MRLGRDDNILICANDNYVARCYNHHSINCCQAIDTLAIHFPSVSGHMLHYSSRKINSYQVFLVTSSWLSGGVMSSTFRWLFGVERFSHAFTSSLDRSRPKPYSCSACNQVNPDPASAFAHFVMHLVIRCRADASIFLDSPAAQQDPLLIWPSSQADGRELVTRVLERTTAHLLCHGHPMCQGYFGSTLTH